LNTWRPVYSPSSLRTQAGVCHQGSPGHRPYLGDSVVTAECLGDTPGNGQNTASCHLLWLSFLFVKENGKHPFRRYLLLICELSGQLLKSRKIIPSFRWGD
jgi:hypothetical protein